MARTSVGQITLYDVTDGQDPILFFMTNENHTFQASDTGVIESGTREGFASTPTVFIGQTAAVFTEDTALTVNNTFRIVSAEYVDNAGMAITPSGWGAPDISNMGVITIPSIASTALASVVIRVAIQVRTSDGTVIPTTATAGTNTIDSLVSLNIVMNGAGGAVVDLTNTGQAFQANSAGTVEDDATINP